MRNKPSIVIITSPFCCIPPDAIGAVEKIWKSAGDYFMTKGAEVKYVCKRPSKNVKSTTNTYYVKGYGRTGSWFRDFLLDFVYSLKALIRAPKADVIVLNTIWTPVLFFLFKWRFKVSLYNVQRIPKRQFRFYKCVNALSCVSCSVYDILLKQTPSALKQACVVNNFIDTGIFSPHKEHSLTEFPMVVYSGRVHREKGLDILVNAINIIREKYPVSLKIIGAWEANKGGSGEDYKRELESMANGWEIQWVPPIYSSEELAKEIDSGDIYCYPSVADNGETFGVAPLEAMGLGLPVVVSALDCFKDFIHDGINGMVFDHHAKDASRRLADCIMTIMHDEQTYKKLSRNAMLTAQDFSVEKKSEEYLTLINNLLKYSRTGFDKETMRVLPIEE